MIKTLLFIFFILIIGCDSREYRYSQTDLMISSKNQGERSTTAGNLVTSAIRIKHNLDVVLYPTEFLNDNSAALYSEKISDQDKESLIDIFPTGEKDKFRLGYMKGKNLKDFIRQRTLERYKVDFEVSGVRYDILLKGGMVLSEQYGFENTKLNDERFYLVAISDYFIRPGNVFPPYMYRNSIDRVFDETDVIVSAREAVTDFLKNEKMIPQLNSIRARVKMTLPQKIGKQKISTIQGKSFLSPFVGDHVETEGIVTAFAKLENLPGGYVAYIQSIEPDLDPKTSEGIKLHFEQDPKLTVGDKVQVKGLVFEESTNPLNALTTTSIRNIQKLNILSSNNNLPDSKKINSFPQEKYSRHVGDLNRKPELDLNDAIDFFESLEGMRVQIKNPEIMGFRGGKETLDDPKRNLSLYVIPETNKKKLRTDFGGVYTKPDEHIFNPDMMTIAAGPLTKGLDINTVYTVGDKIEGEIDGIITFTKNIFGEGEYLFQIPQSSDAIESFNQNKQNTEILSLEQRPRLEANLKSNSLVIAAYNIKNLSSIDKDKKRLQKTAEMIQKNLSCPDILGLVEIQDNNGEDFDGTSEANKTIQNLISYIPKVGACVGVEYVSINVNPMSHREGGVPGANIRVAFIYNKNRVGFKENPPPTPQDETFILPSGHLNFNPGRIAPNSEAFQNTRKSIVAEFTFKGEPVFVIVNHFNSKISDTSHFSTIQPVVRNTEVKRSKLAKVINSFVGMIEKNSPSANIAVLGDFNAYANEMPMKVLETDLLYNLIRTLPRDQWYTTNHNGNSQSLDYIFANRKLKSKLKTFQVPQVNSDFMGRLSDHDPVISVFDF